MGDGGVACMPLQHQHNIMDRLSAPEKALCGGNGFNTKSLKLEGSQPKKKMKKVKKVVTVKKVRTLKSEVALARKDKSGQQVENGEAAAGKVQNDEVEEGELGTLKWPAKEVENGELASEKQQLRKTEADKVETVAEKLRKGEVEHGEYVAGRLRKTDVEKEETVSEKNRRGDAEKGEFRPWRGFTDDVEKGEFIPDRWRRGEAAKDDYSYSRSRRYESVNHKVWRRDLDHTPPSHSGSSGKYSGDDNYRKKEFSKSVSQQSKNSFKWEVGLEKIVKLGSKVVDEGGSHRVDYHNGKNQGRDYFPSSRLKRQGHDADSDNSDRDRDRKTYGDYADYSGSKNRRLSDDVVRPAQSENYSRLSSERPQRNSSSFRMSSFDKHSSKHHEFSLSSRGAYDRHGRSPVQADRSPRGRTRYHDHRERSPVHHERSPYNRERSPRYQGRILSNRDKSPYGRQRSPYARDNAPYSRDKSPCGRERTPYGRERSPYGRDKSPHERSHHFDRRNRSPYAERSPQDRGRNRDRRDIHQNNNERSQVDRGRPNNNRETSHKSGKEKPNIQSGNKGEEQKPNERNSARMEADNSILESDVRISMPKAETSSHEQERSGSIQSHKEDQTQSPSVDCKESPNVNGAPPEELLSMEEDMDICDTPPHVPLVADSTVGKWIYLDYLGFECGPSKLCDLKSLVQDGVLHSDHFIKHVDSDRWMTVENAASPLVGVAFPSIVSESITQLVNPPEAPGNLLDDTVDGGLSGSLTVEEMQLPVANEPLEDLCIDERVRLLLHGFTFIPGRELETIGEALQMTFEHQQWEECSSPEDFFWHQACIGQRANRIADDASRCSDVVSVDLRESSVSDKDFSFSHGDSSDWFSGLWSCKGGDWRRKEEAAQDRLLRRKFVVNDGFPLCQMPKSGNEDPRWHQKDELYHPLQARRLDLPPWAFSWPDERSENDLASRLQVKPAIVRGVKGTMLSVVRINACVVKDQGSFVSEPRMKARPKERYSSRSARSHSSSSDAKRSSVETDSRSRSIDEHSLRGSRKSIVTISIPKDRVCTVHDLQLDLGDWYYFDGAGQEHGPSSYSELQELVDGGTIQKYTSVFRKLDKLWVPVTSAGETSETPVNILKEKSSYGGSSGPTFPQVKGGMIECSEAASSFHSMHPQFIGYMRGKLHELVMRSYKSREFAAVINEVLDPWMSAKQPKKEIDKHIYRRSDADYHAGKRARLSIDETEEESENEEVAERIQWDDISFEDLCIGNAFNWEEIFPPENKLGSWGLLDGHVLARIFHFLRADMTSLAIASSTCKHWNAAVRFYRDISQQVNLSTLGHRCTDSIIWRVLNGYDREKIKSLIFTGCTNITPGVLEDILRSCPCLSEIDIRGCSQLEELTLTYSNINWVKSRKKFGDTHFKMRSLNQLTDRNSAYSGAKGIGGDVDEFSDLKDYFDSVDRRDSAGHSFRRGFYKRSKLFDARKSSSILSRDARVRRWAVKKSEKGYKRIEEFLASSLKDIMKQNTFDFFMPKVAKIDERMKNGYYIRNGISSIKEDIRRICRDAIKAKNRGETGDMNHVISLFIQLATHLGEKDDSSEGFSTSSKYKRKVSRADRERKYASRSNGSSFLNAALNDWEYSSDLEIRRRLSTLNKKSMDSDSETSDDFGGSSESSKSESETTVSDTESDLGLQQDRPVFSSLREDGNFMADDSFDDDREWGARMTKASLVPPVTRKYEVIDHYFIVADEDDVRRKMQVSLPEDYAEKLTAQKNGAEEVDMELPEVKDYKPRKKLGDEVIEQEVYGIDPYTHNLLLDSMPEELDWPLLDKHLFIEDVLLRSLNKQIRHFTGTGNTPMIYPLQPVIEEIERTAEDDHDMRTVRMCRAILRAIDSRSEDKYVAYRKGLGVVCNKEEGFGDDDFVVEFLGEVYPTWKWFEKQDGIRSLQKNNKDPAPEFYNIYLERPKGDADGYDLVVVDAMHKANYASRICHSCRPNCEAKVTAVDGQYQIGIYSVRKIQYGEEITFDYNSVTESKEEYEASVCLCGSQVCRGSYLNLTGEGAFQKVLEEWHGILDRHQLMIESCEVNSVSEEDYYDLGRAGLGSCLLGGLPAWLIAYSARLVRFINFERTKLPEEILRHNLEEKRKYFLDICLEVEKSDAEVQAEGVYNQRLQNLAVTLDKVRYVMRCIFGDPKKAPPPLVRLSPEEIVSLLWKGEGSLVEELLQCMAPHVDDNVLNDLKSKIRDHDPSGSVDIQKELKQSLLWLRDEIRDLPCTYKCRHDAAADLIHVYAYTKCFFKIQGYKSVTSPPVYISPLDLGPKFSDKLGPDSHEYRKTYGENYCLGQLIFWQIQTNTEPDGSLFKASRGCLSLPDIGSFYAKVQKPSRQRVYGPRTMRFMLGRMEKQPQRPWPKDRIWSFSSSPKVFGSPMLDAVLNNTLMDREMLHWLKNRPTVFQAMWDR
ncbi:histone-lysine N-methyltransferase ATXR3 [Rhodamnia argentea]|uniref:Histone-lysine N-methyltransferase ATXR3 n=1 Tax=Rhodamnia argentea TaxID=178133 RepID=A0A8B8QIJ3_9MYRT|nr:histone-lysine N-methyltransferase ATXR3 [Rhodamnia argentea]